MFVLFCLETEKSILWMGLWIRGYTHTSWFIMDEGYFTDAPFFGKHKPMILRLRQLFSGFRRRSRRASVLHLHEGYLFILLFCRYQVCAGVPQATYSTNGCFK
jgi:hypothetical protein